jgi:ATP-dependent DNA helicase RecG
MPEQQNIEYKQNWHDDYLKWVCGFANAQGGVIYLGKDDDGRVVGLADHKRLMDDIPNKIKNAIGIIAEVNLHQESDKYFIEIITTPYTVPISLRGRYYYRSGSTKQELTGASLIEFLLKKSGKTWDDVAEPRASFEDIDQQAVNIFLRASEKAGRLSEIEPLSITELFDKLRLVENGQLKRCAIILFGKNPGRFYPNTFVKIGRFGKDDADLRFQVSEEGNLITLLHTVLSQLNNKFLVSPIEFEGVHRIEKGEFPIAAIREMLLNALVHRNYVGAPTQIRIYDDRISIWNEGTLPEGLNIESLKRSHASRPRNPIIADVCFKAGYIDAWGRGTLKIIQASKEANLLEPTMNEIDGGFAVTLFKDGLFYDNLINKGLTDRLTKAVLLAKNKGHITNKEYQEAFGVARMTATRDLAELVERGFLKYSGAKGAGAYYEILIAP